jgi:hypothetical protein
VFVDRGIHFHIDKVSSFRGDPMEISVVGWCWPAKHRIRGLRLESGSHSAPCLTGLERPDVAAHFGDPDAAWTGMVCRVRVADTSSPIRFIADLDGVDETLAEIPVPVDDAPQVPAQAIGTYAEWLAVCEPALSSLSGERTASFETCEERPLISILLSMGPGSLYYAHRSIESVLRQRHTAWELCIRCEESRESELGSYLERYQERDPRIRVLFRSAAREIPEPSGRFPTCATGCYILPLVPGDELHPAALLEMNDFLHGQPETELLYCDEDHIDDEGRRFSPLFKPAFDFDLLMAFDYIGHPIAVRNDVMERAGGYQAGYDGAGEWDFLLRVSEVAGANRIRHLPKVLYHARARRDSGAMPDVSSRRRVLERHLKRTKRAGTVQEGLFPGSMRLCYEPARGSRTAVIYRAGDGDYQFQALRRTRSAGLELYELRADMLCRAGSSAQPLRMWEDLEGDVVVVVNAPVEYVSHAFFEVLNGCAQREDCGLAGPLLLGSDGKILSAGLLCTRNDELLDPFSGCSFASPGYMGLAKVTRAVATVSPHCFAVSKKRLGEIAGFQAVREDALASVCEMLARAAQADGLKVLYSPYAVASVADSTVPVVSRDICLGRGAPRTNPNIEAFRSSRAIFEKENLS